MFGLFKTDSKKIKELEDKIQELNADLDKKDTKLSESLMKVARLEEKIENAPYRKRLKELEDFAESIPSNAQGKGTVLVIEDGSLKSVKLGSKGDMLEIIEKAKEDKVEIVIV